MLPLSRYYYLWRGIVHIMMCELLLKASLGTDSNRVYTVVIFPSMETTDRLVESLIW